MVDLRQKEQRFATWKQAVWDNWWEGEGNCSGCPIRCENHGANPDYGAFNPDADLMIVGLEPGAASEYVAEDSGGKPRKYRTVPESEAQVPPRQHSEYAYDHKVLAEWDFYWSGPAKLFGVGTSDEDGANREVVDRTPRETYYTNALKCSKLAESEGSVEDPGVTNPETRNEQARIQCRAYLQEEVDLVNPDVVVTFGTEAFTHVMCALEREYSGSCLKDWVNQSADATLLGRHGSDPTVIPAYHWSGEYFSTNMKHAEAIPDGSNESDCWETIAMTVNQELGI